jgi:transcriptional regulator of met regulon
MPRIAKTSSTRRLNLEMTEDVRRRLENLRDRSNAESLAEVIRHALSVYEFLWTEREKGNRIAILGSEDKLGPDSREVVLVS